MKDLIPRHASNETFIDDAGGGEKQDQRRRVCNKCSPTRWLSQAVLQMVTQTVFTRETGADAARLFDLYLSAAAVFLAGNRLMQARLEQDGSALTFTLQRENQQARLHVNLSLIHISEPTRPY